MASTPDYTLTLNSGFEATEQAVLKVGRLLFLHLVIACPNGIASGTRSQVGRLSIPGNMPNWNAPLAAPGNSVISSVTDCIVNFVVLANGNVIVDNYSGKTAKQVRVNMLWYV